MTPFWWLAVLDGAVNVVIVVLPEFVGIQGADGSYRRVGGTSDGRMVLTAPAYPTLTILGESGAFYVLVGASDLYLAIANEGEQRTIQTGEGYNVVSAAEGIEAVQ